MRQPVVVFLNRSQTNSLSPVRNTGLILVEDSPKSSVISDSWAYSFRHHIREGYYDSQVQQQLNAELGDYLVASFSRDKAIEIRSQIDLLVNNGIKTVVISCPDGVSISGAIAFYMHNVHGYVPFKSPTAYYWSARDLNLLDLPKPVDDFTAVNSIFLKVLMDPDYAYKVESGKPTQSQSLLRTITSRLSGKLNA